ncbi:NADP-dependent oxidoreductase domain-containing protein [Biscogniauxia mediterranea]|nr:NADP-dependent oxidoreductase domain-containing protein [Biscogniauxia mediterranea]
MHMKLNYSSLSSLSRPRWPSAIITRTFTPHYTRSFASATMETKSASMPKLMYGTAWKKDATKDLVLAAVKAGFRGVDTAAQPRHYNEALVAAGIGAAISAGIVKRGDVFIQTKFTSVSGQDPDNMPYDPKAPLEDQVHASVASSLRNFTFGSPEEAYIDSLVLHSPLNTLPATMRVWKALETYVPHKIRQLGISNTDLHTLDQLYSSPDITVRPACVQNRFYPATQWEVMLRAYCRHRGIMFQSFWTLTGNPELVRSPPVLKLAESARIDAARALYALVLGLEGTTILDGTRSEAHMKGDLEVPGLVENFSQSADGQNIWSECLADFKTLIGERPGV